MSTPVFPNTLIIGIQKAGTTSLDDWLNQHPQIYCYNTLKDVLLFFRFKTRQEIESRMAKEIPAYNNEPVVLQSAVNYIFYPQYLQKLHEYQPNAKLIVVLRNPVERAVSSYFYFRKMQRETRSPEEALIYPPKENFIPSRDNHDFTYIEHGFYYRQLKACFHYFKKEQVLVLDYDELVSTPQTLLNKIFSFLAVDNYTIDTTPSNVTGNVKNQALQSSLVSQNKYRKWVVDHLIDSWLPVSKRKALKKRLFEMNTSKKKTPAAVVAVDKAQLQSLKAHLTPLFLDDTKQLDELLGTSFYDKWFAAETINTDSSHV